MEEERTNGETLIHIKGYGQASLSSAKSFLHFDGDHRQLKSWKERFLMEHKDKATNSDKTNERVWGYGRPLSKSAKRLCA